MFYLAKGAILSCGAENSASVTNNGLSHAQVKRAIASTSWYPFNFHQQWAFTTEVRLQT
jgi:hypothetical protein